MSPSYRDLLDPIPLLQILAEILGLEQELDISGDSYLEMSVQWEIVLMVVQSVCTADQWRPVPPIPPSSA